jgi:hypothetical protein
MLGFEEVQYKCWGLMRCSTKARPHAEHMKRRKVDRANIREERPSVRPTRRSGCSSTNLGHFFLGGNRLAGEQLAEDQQENKAYS